MGGKLLVLPPLSDAHNASAFVGAEIERYWMGSAASSKTGAAAKTPGVDLYVGGTEHAVLHLLYSRFWHKILFDLGHVSTPEPFFKLVNQGLILGEDGQKMSKSRGNVVNPDDVVSDMKVHPNQPFSDKRRRQWLVAFGVSGAVWMLLMGLIASNRRQGEAESTHSAPVS